MMKHRESPSGNEAGYSTYTEKIVKYKRIDSYVAIQTFTHETKSSSLYAESIFFSRKVTTTNYIFFFKNHAISCKITLQTHNSSRWTLVPFSYMKLAQIKLGLRCPR